MSKFEDSLIGFAIGDAMGVPVEFEDRDELLKDPVTRMLGYGSYDVPEGTWSDDTSMTIATIDSIIKCNGNINYNDIADRFCNWINKAEYTATNEVFDIGITTKYALIRYMEKKEHAELCGGTAFNENGNGSLMRMLPVAFYCYNKNIEEDKKIYEIVKNVSSITHAHEISILGCFIYVKYMIFLLEGKDKFSAYNMIKNIKYKEFFSEETIKEYNRIINDDIEKYSIDEINSTGFVVHSLETALWLILNSDKYSTSIIGAINLGGDTDTIAAITGSMAGLIYGYLDIPEKWISKLRRLDYLKSLSFAFDECFK